MFEIISRKYEFCRNQNIVDLQIVGLVIEVLPAKPEINLVVKGYAQQGSEGHLRKF